MTRRQNSATGELERVDSGEEDFLRPLVQEVVQQVLEAEMEEVLCAKKGGAHEHARYGCRYSANNFEGVATFSLQSAYFQVP